MNLPVIFKPEAREDIEDLEEYLADRFSPGNAQRYTLRLVAACVALGMAPQRGSKREDIGPGVRSLGFERRISIIFDVREEAVYILAVLYGGRLPLPKTQST